MSKRFCSMYEGNESAREKLFVGHHGLFIFTACAWCLALSNRHCLRHEAADHRRHPHRRKTEVELLIARNYFLMAQKVSRCCNHCAVRGHRQHKAEDTKTREECTSSGSRPPFCIGFVLPVFQLFDSAVEFFDLPGLAWGGVRWGMAFSGLLRD